MREGILDLAQASAQWRTWTLMGGQDVRMRYKRSILGPFWISISLAAMILGLALLWSEIFDRPFQEYLSYLAAGLLVWYLLVALINDACTCVLEGEVHLRNLPLPMSLLAARSVMRNMIIFAHNLLAVVVALALFNHQFTWHALLAIPALALLVVFGLGAAMTLGPLCTRFRDITQVIGSVMQLAFFLTPVIWHAGDVSRSKIVLAANPFYHLIETIRAPLLGHLPTDINWMVAAGMAFGSLALGVLTVSATRKQVYLWL